MTNRPQQMTFTEREPAEEARARFSGMLGTLPPAAVILSGEETPSRSPADMDRIFFARVAKRPNLPKLGSYVAVDTETTGVYPSDRIVEVSALRFVNFEPVEIFSTLINPKKPIPAGASGVHGITDAMVAGAPEFWQIVPSLTAFMAGYPIVGHNLLFDLRFLYKFGLPVMEDKRKFYDTLQIARSFLKKPGESTDGAYDVADHRLETLCDFYGIVRDHAHRSGSDCLATGLLFKKLLEDRAAR